MIYTATDNIKIEIKHCICFQAALPFPLPMQDKLRCHVELLNYIHRIYKTNYFGFT